MNDVEVCINSILKKKNRNYTWLSREIGYTRQGLKFGLANKTIKLEVLEKIAEVLEVDICDFISRTEYDNQVSIESFFSNEFLNFTARRYNSFFEKLDLYKDVFVWKVLKMTTSGQEVVIPYLDDKEGNFISDDDKTKIIFLPFEMITEPYSQWLEEIQTTFKDEYGIIEAFYTMIFVSNFLNISDLMADGIIKDKEMIGYYKKWKKK